MAKGKRGTEKERERRGSEREEEGMRRGKERKRANKTSNVIGIVRKYLIGEEMGKKGFIKVQNPYFISINRMIRKYILSSHP